MIKLVFALTICGMVAGCGGLGGSSGSLGGSAGSSAGSTGSAGSSAGSFGLFSRKNRQPATVVQKSVVEHGSFVPLVQDVWIEQVRGGAIIRAKGIASRQGYYDVKLRAPDGLKPDENGVLTLEFRAKQPTSWTTAPTLRSREIIVGRFVSRQKLDQTRRIIVLAATNQVTIGR